MKRVERIVLLCLALTSLAAIGFIAVYVTSNDTQLLGVSLGLAFLFLAVATIVAGKRIVDQRKVIEERPGLDDVAAEEELVRSLGAIQAEPDGSAPTEAEKLSRKRLLLGAAGTAGVVGAAMIVPLASLGPKVGNTVVDTPWAAGRRLVDDNDQPIPVSKLAIGSYMPAFPEGADKRDLGSPVVLVRVDPRLLDLPPERANWAVAGILAFSRICTHAGCAISLFRYPLYGPTSPTPALICPCHYSTFNVLDGGERIFGPAGRSLPQLPLALDPERHLIAAGEFSGPIGPSYLSSRRHA